MESHFELTEVTFDMLQCRLIALVNFRIRNGEFTERGLSRILNISQPQMHNVLKGRRRLQWELADSLLRKLDITIVDLLSAQQVTPQGEDRLFFPEGPDGRIKGLRRKGIDADFATERKPSASEPTLWPARGRIDRYGI